MSEMWQASDNISANVHGVHSKQSTPGPRLMRVHLVQNSTSAKFEKSPNIHLVRPIIHLVRIFALSD